MARTAAGSAARALGAGALAVALVAAAGAGRAMAEAIPPPPGIGAAVLSVPPGSTCAITNPIAPAGTVDCKGRCITSLYIAWVGDGICDNGPCAALLVVLCARLVAGSLKTRADKLTAACFSRAGRYGSLDVSTGALLETEGKEGIDWNCDAFAMDGGDWYARCISLIGLTPRPSRDERMRCLARPSRTPLSERRPLRADRRRARLPVGAPRLQ